MEKDFNGNFLHNIPKALVLKQRVALEAISFSFDAIEIFYSRLVKTLSCYPNAEALKKIKRIERINIFSIIWSLVDSCHAVQQLMISSEKKTKLDRQQNLDFEIRGDNSNAASVAKKYISDYAEKIRSLRNKMDHLGGNLNAIAASKSTPEPLFGTLSYILSDPESLSKNEFDVIVLGSVGFTKGSHAFRALNPADIRRKIIYSPVDHLQFCAFYSIVVNITDLFEDTMAFRDSLNNEFASTFAAALRKHAKENNLKESDVFDVLPDEFVVGMHMQMVNENDTNENNERKV